MDWSRWRGEFPSCNHVVHMNHAGVAPLSRAVAGAVRTFVDEALVLDGKIYARWEQRAEAVRAAFARLVGADTPEVAFIQNTSEGLSLLAAGLDWRAGDNVVAVADDYPSNVYPWWGLRRWGVETRMAPHPPGRFGVDDVAAVMDGRTRLLAVSAVDWQSGFRADLATLGNLCRERGILFCVDGIQAVGAMRVDVAAAGIDCLAAGGHKWLLAPEGCGGLFVSSRVVERFSPIVLGWKSVVDADRYLPYHFDLRRDAARFEAGSPPHLGIHALGAALDLLLTVGPAVIEKRILALTGELAEGLRSLGAKILSPWRDGERSGILTFELGDSRALHAAFTQAAIISRVRMGGVRLAPHFYNNAEDIARILSVAEQHRRGN